ncbi:MAG TPA: M81 family metallopeptidase [Usitatibacter sp.]|nr:M81 family metallopeptidase [Usitatibacter sp.]
MRIFLGALAHETNTFSPVATTRESFAGGLLHHRGDAATLARARQFPGYSDVLQIAQGEGDECVAGMCAWAEPGGPLPRADYEELRDELLADLRSAGRVDFVLLVLHGAMVAQGHYWDCEGDILRRVRGVVGESTPVGALLDLHGNVTEDMVAGGAILVACKEYPHTDYPQRARELYALLARSAREGLRVRTVMRRVPMLGILGTTEGPMRGFVRKMQEGEHEPGIATISAMHGFPWSDTPYTSAAMLVVHDAGDTYAADNATRVARELSTEFFEMRKSAPAKRMPIEEALDAAARESERNPGRPVVIADSSDNPGGGAPSDSTFVLRAMLERGMSGAALGMIWDPACVATATRAGVGREANLSIGGRCGPMSGEPIQARATVLACRGDASQRMFGELREDLGPAVAIRVAGVEVIVNSIRQQVFSPDCFAQLGIDPASKRFLVVKSTQHFRAHFDPIAGATVYCDAPGALNTHLASLPYRNLRRPIWPLDAGAQLG